MQKEIIVANSARLAGILLLIATIPHVLFSGAEVMQAIKFADIRSPMVATTRNLWLFSSIMLPLTGIWALFLASDLRKLSRRAWWQAILIGLGYTGGAIAAMIWSGLQIHLLLFALIGLLLIIPAVLNAGSFWSRKMKNH